MIDLILSNTINLITNHAGFFSFFVGNLNVEDFTPIKTGLIGLGAGTATTGCLGAGIGQGFSAGKAAEAIGRNPEAAPKIQTIFIIGAAIAESGAIYSLLIAIILLFVFGNT